MADKVELLVAHYHETFALTTKLWEQRNRLFLYLIGTIGLATLLTFRTPEHGYLLLEFLSANMGLDDPEQIQELKTTFPFAILYVILLLMVFYLMFNLYHRSHSVLRQYAYLGALETEIRELLHFGKSSKAFTRESDFYWSQRPQLLGIVKYVYVLLLGGLLVLFLGLRVISDASAAGVWLFLADIIVGSVTLIYFVGYWKLSIELDNSEATSESRATAEDLRRFTYAKLALIVFVCLAGVFAVTYVGVHEESHVWFSLSRFYLMLPVGAVLSVVILFSMRNVYRDKKKNAWVIGVSVFLTLVGVGMLRHQSFVGDTAYLKAMIPLHSTSILTSEQAGIEDLRVRELAESIRRSQDREIKHMEWLINDIRENGPATRRTDAGRRPIPDLEVEP